MLRRAEELSALVRDIAQVASSTGPAGVSRTVQAARAIFELGVKTIQSGNLERMTAPSALRQLFEALGATYIKFGQFIKRRSGFERIRGRVSEVFGRYAAGFFGEIKRILEEEGLDIDRGLFDRSETVGDGERAQVPRC